MVVCPSHLYTPCTFVHSPYIHMPPIHLYTLQGCTQPPRAPHALCSCLVLEHCMLWGVFFCLMCIGTHHPYLGVPPLNYTPPHSIVGSLCIFILRDISSYVGLSPSMEGFGGVPPSLGWLGGTSALQLFTCSFLYIFFVVHYVSHVNHSSDYYSSSYSGVFWPVISVISVSGSFPDRVSSKPWCGSSTTLDAKELWRWSWLHFCVAAASSIFNASSGLCQLCYGFSTGRFLFQS